MPYLKVIHSRRGGLNLPYSRAIKYLESFVNYEKYSKYSYKEALSLKRIQAFLGVLHNPQNSFKSIHIAGSKGKGSTSAFITYILREAGFKVGFYTSPHLSDFRERIRILLPGKSSLRATKGSQAISFLAGVASFPRNGVSRTESDFEGMISKARFAGLARRLKPAIEQYNLNSRYGALTFFEVCTAIAFVYFKEEKVDFAVLETGLGGRLDATNVINPLVCVITPISYEHTDKLGDTLTKIASEKAGIIKSQKSKVKSQKSKTESQKLTVISSPQEKEALDVIRNKCKKEGANLLLVGKDIKYNGQENDFRVKTHSGKYERLQIRLAGAHQLINAVTALAAVESLEERGIKVSIDSIRRGLYNTLWPGRCEVVNKGPFVILDGAQNSASAGVLKRAIKERFHYRRLILILGVSNDKDIKGIAGQLRTLASTVILTKSNNPRASEPRVLKKYFTGRGKEIHITDNIKAASSLALRIAKKEDLILVTGSLFVVGEFRLPMTQQVRIQLE